jgi:hypothetical protein
LKDKHIGPTTVNLSDLLKWCDDHNEPESGDYVFLANFEYKVEKGTLIYFRLFLTTKRLIKNMKLSIHVCADGTYKLMWNCYPALVAGTTDWTNSFHPYGLAVTLNEKEESYQFLFESLIKSYEYVFGKDDDFIEYKSTALVADNADAISNGFEHAFGYNDQTEYKRIHCYAHLLGRVDERLRRIENSQLL